MYQGTFIVFHYPPCGCNQRNGSTYSTSLTNASGVRKIEIFCRECKMRHTVPMGDLNVLFQEGYEVRVPAEETVLGLTDVDARLTLLDDE